MRVIQEVWYDMVYDMGWCVYDGNDLARGFEIGVDGIIHLKDNARFDRMLTKKDSISMSLLGS